MGWPPRLFWTPGYVVFCGHTCFFSRPHQSTFASALGGLLTVSRVKPMPEPMPKRLPLGPHSETPSFYPVLELLQDSLSSVQGSHKYIPRDAQASPVLLTLVTGTLSISPPLPPFLNLPPFDSIPPLLPMLLKPSMVFRLNPTPPTPHPHMKEAWPKKRTFRMIPWV